MYKALITDLDGTAIGLTSNGEDIDAATRGAVQQAIAEGKKIACATGREWTLAEPVIRRLGLVSPCIIEGGTRIVTAATGRTVWQKPFGEGVSAKVFQLLKNEATSGVLMHSATDKRRPLGEVKSVPAKLRFIYLLGISEITARSIQDKLAHGDDAVAHFTPSWIGGGLVDIHITDPEATKEHAIRIWQKLEKVTHEETIGLGDSGNDIPIFQSAGLKVAVGNATESLKAVADYVAPTVRQHALEYVIRTYLLDH